MRNSLLLLNVTRLERCNLCFIELEKIKRCLPALTRCIFLSIKIPNKKVAFHPPTFILMVVLASKQHVVSDVRITIKIKVGGGMDTETKFMKVAIIFKKANFLFRIEMVIFPFYLNQLCLLLLLLLLLLSW